MINRARALALLLALVVGAAAPAGQERAPSPGAWRTFEGTWSGSGERQVLPVGGGRQAATVQLSGAIVLTIGEGLSRGFRGEVIAFDDGVSLSVGRAVWTDERGDQIFWELKGEPWREGRRIVGRLTGGTGRYSSLEGDSELTWQYVVAGEGGSIQGRSVGLKGRVRAKEAGR